MIRPLRRDAVDCDDGCTRITILATTLAVERFVFQDI